jgi:phosphoglycerate dehydrogenase-like enzyme
MAGPNAYLAVGRGLDQFVRPEKMAELKSLVNLTAPPVVPKEEAGYARALREAKAEIVITGWGAPRLTRTVQKENPQLKYMCNMTGAVRGMLDKDCIEAGLLVTNWGNLIGPTVAEGALMGILSCLRRTTEVAFLMHQEKGWRKGDQKDVQSLFHQKVGLHGFGIIAQNLVELIRPFKCDISTYSPNAPDASLAKYGVKRERDLKSLYSKNHVISIHASNTPENRHIVNAEILASMQDGAVLVNTARGAIVDTAALIAELKRGRIQASLDVYDPEPPPPDSPLRGLLNCQLTCHTAGPTPDRMVDFGDAAIDNVRRYVSGQPVERVVDAKKYDLIT